MDILLNGIQKSFGGVPTLGPLNIGVEAGELVSILGPSGCGKSTLLKIIAGLENPTSGSLSIPVNNSAFVFQDPHLLPWKNVLQNTLLPLSLLKISPNPDLALKTLKKVGLESDAHLFPHQLSGGMKMRVSIARALITSPKILLMDEPFAALDERRRNQLDFELRALWKSTGMTVFFVTHSVSEAAYIGNRVLVFSPKPAQLILDQRVPFPMDRPIETKFSADFLAYTQKLSAVLNEEHTL